MMNVTSPLPSLFRKLTRLTLVGMVICVFVPVLIA
jgi:hypothetical protein